MKDSEVKVLIELRTNLITQFSKLRDYKNNPNAIMKEKDHARSINDIIVIIDALLKDYVDFKYFS